MQFALVFVLIVLGFCYPANADVLLSEKEIDQTLLHGPWPPVFETDPSNRVSGKPIAISLGEALFNDPILSDDGKFSRATCHDPKSGFTTRDPKSVGRKVLQRNALSLWNLGAHRWFGWDGSSDNLWAQSMIPIIAPLEMNSEPAALKEAIIRSDHRLDYERLFGSIETQDAETVLVNLGKTLAAYQERLVSNQSAFDRFRDALAAGDLETVSQYPVEAQRGLKIFLGDGNCAVCHTGPAFTNGEFHDAGVPYFLSETEVDTGRFGGLQQLFDSRYTLDGDFSDDLQKSEAWAVRQVRQTHADFGVFRTPGLRNVTETAPYMHNGSLPDLKTVVHHYNNIDLERMHTDGEAILRPLGLTDSDIGDLIKFLESWPICQS